MLCLISAGLCVVLASPGARADGQATGASDANAGDELKQEVLTYRAIPTSIRQQSFLRLDDQGEVQLQKNELHASFTFTPDPELEILAYRVKNLRIETSNGDQPLVTSRHPDSWSSSQRRGGAVHERLNIVLTMESPDRTASALTRVVGDVEFLIGEGPIEKSELGPYQQIKGKMKPVPGLDDVRIKIEPENNNRTRVTMEGGKGWQLLYRIHFVNERGGVIGELDQSVGFQASTRDSYGRVHRFSVPDPARVVFHTWSEVTTRVARIEATNVPLPAGLADHAVELSRASPGEPLAAALNPARH